MEKIRVNDPCPCGSGKKYKRCCKDADALPVTVGIPHDLTALIGPPLKRQLHNFLPLLRTTSVTLIRRAMRRAEWRDPSTLDADRVRMLIAEIDEAARRLLQPHSRQYWYFLVRRVPPEFWGNLDVLLTATHLVLTCGPPGDAREFHRDAGVKGIDYSDVRDRLPAVIELMALAHLKHEASVLYRLACKGVQIYDDDTHEPLLAHADESIGSYESRRDEHETLTGSAGLWLDPVNEVPLKPDFSHLWAIREPHDGEEESTAARTIISHDPARVIDLRFGPCIYKGVHYDFWLGEFSRPVEWMLGVTGAEVSAFLYALFQVVTHVLRYPEIHFTDTGTGVFKWPAGVPTGERQNALSHWADLAAMGLLRASEGSWREQLCYYAALLASRDPDIALLDENKIGGIMKAFTGDYDAGMDLDHPVLFNKLSSETLVLDLLRAWDFLRYLMVLVSKSDELHERQKKGETEVFVGRYFERQAADFFIRTLGLDPGKVVVSKTIKRGKEIDIAFVHEDTLFVFDCKALRKDAGYVEGHHRKIRNRLDKVREEFKKCEARVELIRRGFVKPTILPADFSKSRVMICTSAVEYLPLRESLFWYEGKPSVGTPSELVETIRLCVA